MPTGTTQQIINYGATANDGLGDPLRTAFIKTDENFSNIWAAGPVGSNITITDNTIFVDDTNGNLILMPNGVGIIESRNHFIPRLNNVYNLGTPDLRWHEIYTNRVTAQDMTLSGNLIVEGNIVQTGNTVTQSLVLQLANLTTEAFEANGAGIVIGANSNIATFLYNSTTNTWETNVPISANSLSPGGVNGSIQFNNDGRLSGAPSLRYDVPSETFTVGNGPLRIATVTSNVFSNVWQIHEQLLRTPAGGSWRSDPDLLTEYISSPNNGFLDISSKLNGNTKSQLFLEHGKIRLTVNDGDTSDWEFNEDGTTYFPHFSFPNTTPTIDQVLISNATGNLTWTTIKVNEIFNGTTSVSIPDANGNVVISVGETENVIVVNDIGAEIYGNLSVIGETQSESLKVSGIVDVGANTSIPGATLQVGGTDSILVPVGNTDQRPSGVTGMVRFNTTLDTLEFYNSTEWTTSKTDFTVIVSDRFNGDGLTTNFTLSQPSTTDGTIVSVNGIVQEPTVSYLISDTTLSFTEAPGPLDIIDARILTTTVSVGQLSNSGGNAVIGANVSAAQIDITGSLVPTVDGIFDIGSLTNSFNRVYATSTSAVYSDLAEMYSADAPYPPGTVLSFGGNAEVTESHVDADERVAGVVSTAPSYLMNSTLSGDNVVAVALTGRVPTRVTGSVRKGDMMVSNGDGRARAEHNPRIGTVIGKALANFNGADGMIEVVVGRL